MEGALKYSMEQRGMGRNSRSVRSLTNEVWQNRTPPMTHHGKPDVNSISFLDAHAEQVKTEYENDGQSTRPKYNTGKYFFIFPEYLD